MKARLAVIPTKSQWVRRSEGGKSGDRSIDRKGYWKRC